LTGGTSRLFVNGKMGTSGKRSADTKKYGGYFIKKEGLKVLQGQVRCG